MSADKLRELAHDLRLIAASRLDGNDARRGREAADEFAAIAAALEAGGAIVGTYVVVPLSRAGDYEVRPAPIPPPLSGKHQRPASVAAARSEPVS